MRLAFRQLLKSPGFTLVAVITLALGLGANAAVFAFVRDMLLHPLAQQSRRNLVSLFTQRQGPNQDFRRFTYAEFAALRDSRQVFADVSAFNLRMAAIGQRDEFKRSLISFVPENYFAIFGVQPLAGRFFTAEEARPDSGAAVVVVNHTYWQRLGGRPDFVGSQLVINRQTFTVVGIAPQGFGGLHASVGPDVWLPLGALPLLYDAKLLDPRTTELFLFGRLQHGVTLASARPQASVLAARLNALQPGEDPRTLLLTRPPIFDLGNTRPNDESYLVIFATLAMSLSAAVLLVACLNLASLLLARGAARRKEIAIRLSLGASRFRVVRQLLLEGLLLALLGGGLGLLLSVWTGDFLLQWAKAAFAASPFALTIQPAIDVSLLVVSLGFCLVATLAFSLLPALRCTRVNLVEDLKARPGAVGASGHWNRFFSLRHCLLMAQLALSLMLLFSAGLFVRGSHAATKADRGFSTERQLVANLDYGFAGFSAEEINRRQNALLDEARALPGVTSAALASAIPFNFDLSFSRVFAAGQPLDERATRTAPRAGFTSVSHGYFGTLGIPLLRGRDFTAAESTQPGTRGVAVIDDALAAKLFPGADALGRHLVFNPGDVTGRPEREVEIVGIVRSPENDVFSERAPFRVYRPLAQDAEPNTYVHLQLAASAVESTVLDRLRHGLAGREPAVPLLSLRPLSDYVELNINALLVQLAGKAFSAFGLVAALLAVVGVYGLKAYAVVQRTQEIGIRMALGAQVADVLSLFLRQGAVQIGVAIAGGLALSLLAGLALSKMLYRVQPFDPLLLALATGIIAVTALIASWLPARRAARVDPSTALRTE